MSCSYFYIVQKEEEDNFRTFIFSIETGAMNIVITGTSKGIGAEIVKILCKHKGNKIVAISRSGDGLRKLLNECHKINPEAKLLTAEFDLSQFGKKLIRVTPLCANNK